MASELLKCDNCGGPLSRTPNRAQAQCEHCGQVTVFSNPPPPEAPPPVTAFGGGPVVQIEVPRVVVSRPGGASSARWLTLFVMLLPVIIWLGTMWFTSQAQDRVLAAEAAAKAAELADRARMAAEQARTPSVPPSPFPTHSASKPVPPPHPNPKKP